MKHLQPLVRVPHFRRGGLIVVALMLAGAAVLAAGWRPQAATTAALGAQVDRGPAGGSASDRVALQPAAAGHFAADVNRDGTVGINDLLLVLSAWGPCAGCPEDVDGNGVVGAEDVELVLRNWGSKGQDVFRYQTYGDEQNWTDFLRMHEVIETHVDPLTALSVGLKVDADSLPPAVIDAILDGQVDLTDPATTLTLIELDAVVGVVGNVQKIDGAKRLVSVVVSCALCHSTVDNSVMAGIGSRLDGWPNLDLDPGAILALSPAIPEESKAVYRSWGPGKFDPRFNIDGLSTPIVIPPAYGLSGVDRETFTGDGELSYWNRYVAVTQMGGHGTFIDPELGIKIIQRPDMVAPWLPALRDYQLGLAPPPPPAGSFDPEAARRGERLFHGAANCASCHMAPLYTDINREVLHAAEETGMDPSYAQRTKTGLYRTTPLRALWQHPPYFHDGIAATLLDVVEHYDAFLDLQLTESEKHDLAEFLKSL